MADIMIQPPKEWLFDTPRGDVALCDPFSGTRIDPNQPPQAFIDDYTLGNGYGTLLGNRMLDPEEGLEEIGVYLTDPSSVEGLGDREALEEIMLSFEMVVFDSVRTPMITDRIRRLNEGRGIGSVMIGSEIAPSDDYTSALMDAIIKTHKGNMAVDINPSRDFFSGEPDTPGGRALQSVRDVVIGQSLDQNDPSDPDVTHAATDLICGNTIDWHQIATAGGKLADIRSEFGRMPKSMLWITPAERSDGVRKIRVASGIVTNGGSALDEFASDPDYLIYNRILELGYIPRKMFEGTEY